MAEGLRVLRIVPVLLASVSLLAGCADLAAIREFAATSTQAAQYKKIVIDYVEAPSRIQAQYARPEQKERWEEVATTRRDQEPRLLTFQQVVGQYMDSLGQLAADDAVVYDKELDGLNNAVKGAKFLKTDESDAIATITKAVLKAAADAWRRRQLKELIEASNAPFQTVIAALHKDVRQGFGGELDTEEVALRNHYETLVKSSSDLAGIAALKEWEGLRRAELSQRRDSVRAYVTVLEKIAAGHEALYKNRNHLSDKQLLADLHRYAKDMQAAFNAVRALR